MLILELNEIGNFNKRLCASHPANNKYCYFEHDYTEF